MNLAPSLEKRVGNSSSTTLKIIANNFQSLAGIARDMNVARQNAQKLVTLMGGKKATGADAHFLKAGEREKRLEIETKPTLIPEKPVRPEAEPAKKPSSLKRMAEVVKRKTLDTGKSIIAPISKMIKNVFSPKSFMGTINKLAMPVLIVTTLWQGIKGAWDAYQETGSIFESFKGSIGQIVDFFTFGMIDKKMVGEFMNEIPKFFEPIAEAATNFFGKIGEWFGEKFEAIKELFVGKKTELPKPKTVTPEKPGAPEGQTEEQKKAEKATEEQRKAAEETSRQRKEETAKLKEEEAKKAREEAERDQSLTRAAKQEEARKKEEAAKVAREKAEAAKGKPTPAPIAAPTPTPAPVPQIPVERPGKPRIEKLPEPKPSEEKPKKLSSTQGKEVILSEMDRQNITDPTARAAIMAQVGHESGNFTTLSENLNYKAQTLLKLFPKKFSSPEDAQQVSSGGPQAVAERIYGGRMGNAPEGSGDGFLYRGRGFIQLTGKQNYTRFGYAGNPEEVAKPQTAAESAIKFIMGYKGDWGDVKKLTKFVNGGYIGLEDRAKHFEAYLQDPKITQVEPSKPAISGGTVAQVSNEVASDQRQQQKPQTPVIINTTTVNNTAVNKNVSTVVATKENAGNKAAARVA